MYVASSTSFRRRHVASGIPWKFHLLLVGAAHAHADELTRGVEQRWCTMSWMYVLGTFGSCVSHTCDVITFAHDTIQIHKINRTNLYVKRELPPYSHLSNFMWTMDRSLQASSSCIQWINIITFFWKKTVSNDRLVTVEKDPYLNTQLIIYSSINFITKF